jgi:hypothetical protein
MSTRGWQILSPPVVTRAQRRSWGARPTTYRYRMPVRLEDEAEIASAALIVHVAEIESASLSKGDAWASKVDADCSATECVTRIEGSCEEVRWF